jgi:hypothetical protein
MMMLGINILWFYLIARTLSSFQIEWCRDPFKRTPAQLPDRAHSIWASIGFEGFASVRGKCG